jgi:cytochrome bd-type quinol oxidase subunit 2
VAACLVPEYRGVQPVNERIVTLTKIFVFAGIFFFVLAFGHALPNVIAGIHAICKS